MSLDFFRDVLSSVQTMALRRTQPLVKMSTRNIRWGKADKHSAPLSRNLGALISLIPFGLHGVLWESFTLYILTDTRSHNHSIENSMF